MRELGSLDGLWRFRTGEDKGGFASPALNDSCWDVIRVPAHWHTEGYRYYAGEAWYRTHFPTPIIVPGERCLLRFDAVDYLARVWLNGVYLGEHEGYFAPFAFDIAPHLSSDGENVLAVQVLNPPDVKNLVKGALMRWDCNDPRGNPGGVFDNRKEGHAIM
jgi:beta-mannosidase